MEHVLCTSIRLKNGSVLVDKKLGKYSSKLSFTDIMNEMIGDREIGPDVNKALNRTDFSCKLGKLESDITNGNGFEIEPEEILETAFNFDANFKYISFVIDVESEDSMKDANNNIASKTVSAFDVLMEKTIDKHASCVKIDPNSVQRFTEKDRLFNNVCEYLDREKCFFPRSMAIADMKKDILVLVNIFWYLDGNTSKFADRAVHGEVAPIPERFLQSNFIGYNDWKKKRVRAPFLTLEVLKSHSTALFRFLGRKYTTTWNSIKDDLESLALALDSYAAYLDRKCENQQKRHLADEPPRQITEHTWLETHEGTGSLNPKYSILDNTVRKLENYEYLYFNEELHLDHKFKSYSERYHYIERIRLSVPICILTYCPAANVGKIVYLWKLPVESTPKSEVVQKAMKIYGILKDRLPEYHTRQMRKDFVNKYSNLNAVKIPKHILRHLYSEFQVDATALQNPAIESRVQEAILSEDPNLVIDLRKLNTGAPGDTFNDFYEKLNTKVQEFAAVDERRHGDFCHFSHYISVRDLIAETVKELPESTPVPSESGVLYSFVPKNSHAKTAKLYTSKVNLQFKVQTRQLRQSSIDQHYCAAQFKYAREYAIKFREHATFLAVDDKCKVDYGEPGQAIQTGVRGKKGIVATGATLSALDHDQQSKGSLTPSVVLKVDIPEDISGSFYRGEVCVTYKDSVFEASSPFRHACEIEQFLAMSGVRPILIIYSDGGPDHRVNYHSVKLSLIVLFKRLGLDTIIAVRTAPGNSWLNPAERQMSILNLALQNCALMRAECSSDIEQIIRSCNSMADIRQKASKTPGLQEEWEKSVRPIKEFLGERTKMLVLKDVPFLVQDAADASDVEEREGNIQMYIDSNIEKGKYQQQHLKSKKEYQKFLKDHTKERHYMFQVRKCDDLECCGPRLEEDQFPWLPDPVIRDDDKDHYKPFSDVLNTETQEGRPSAEIQTPREVAEQLQGVRNQGLVAQNVRRIVNCYECCKPRCIYSRKALSVRDSRALTRMMEKHDYTCGSLITPEGDALDGLITVRLQMLCQTPVEYSYYASVCAQVCQDVCAHCAQHGAERDRELLKQFNWEYYTLASRTRKLMVMVACLVQQFVSVGLGLGLSIMYVELIAVFDAKRSDAALIQGLYLGLAVGTGIILTGVIKKVGPGPTIIAGAIVACIGLFSSAFAENIGTITALTGVLAGIGMSTCYLSAFICVSWIFHENPGFPLVCLTIGSSLGQFTIPFLYEYFISEYTWSGAFILVSGIALQCIPFGVIIHTSREYFVKYDHSKDEGNDSSTCEGYTALLKDIFMWIILFDFLLVALSGNVEAWFIVDIMTSRGYTRESGSILVSVLGFANFIGRVIGSTVRLKCSNIPTVYHWLWLCPVIAVGHILVIKVVGFWDIMAACILQGAAFGMNNSQTPTIMYEASGLARYPQAMSMVNLMYGIGFLFSNVIGGFIRDRFGVYDVAYYIAAAVSILITFNSAIVSCLLHRRKNKEVQYEVLVQ